MIYKCGKCRHSANFFSDVCVRYFDYGAGKHRIFFWKGGEECEDDVKTKRDENFCVKGRKSIKLFVGWKYCFFGRCFGIFPRISTCFTAVDFCQSLIRETREFHEKKSFVKVKLSFKVLFQVINFLFAVVVDATNKCKKYWIMYVSGLHFMLTFWSFSGLLWFLCTTFTFASGNYSARGSFFRLELSSFLAAFNVKMFCTIQVKNFD
jgi:hypothetical protein